MDYYLEDIRRLEGLPKKTIADYVEQNGILVPQRFDSLAEGRKSGKPIFLRSEHPQDYNGMSGLLDSFSLTNSWYKAMDSISVDEVKQIFFEKSQNKHGHPLYYYFCKFHGLDVDEFKKEISFSVWEELSGVNRTVVADSSIKGRYHIMSFKYEIPRVINYCIAENGKVVRQFVFDLPKELENGIEKLIDAYEKVRNLPRFDSNHCPIMEFQTVNDKNYFLQYHRTRDFSPSEFTLERAIQEGEIEVPFVRGATPMEGRNHKVTLYYAGSRDWSMIPEDEDGSFDFHTNWIFSDMQFKKRKLQAISDMTEIFYIVAQHHTKSQFFKPEISTIVPPETVLKNNEVLCSGNFADGQKYSPRDPILKSGETVFNFYEEAKKGHNTYMMLHLISDGRKAFVRRID
jgi:hypothetical protein